ncbi:hypothetical protein [Amycolatopsis sp. NPDC059021]|uniref:hypothetical protein n=1 Tax=Amycolatopsis sp. NPDC059021 TaxID=3346704 RepID=UPI0036729C6A
MRKKLITRMTGIAALCALLMNPLTTATANAAPVRAATHLGTFLLRGDVMALGDYITSADGNFRLEMQTDGNLVEYNDAAGGIACWASNTNGRDAFYATYQRDGNFVVYTGSGDPLWASNTVGDRGSTVNISTALLDYGSLYVGQTRIHTYC